MNNWLWCWLVLIPGLLMAQPVAMDQPLGLTIEAMPLPEALRRLEEATDWRFSYDPRELPSQRRVSLNHAQQSLLPPWSSGWQARS